MKNLFLRFPNFTDKDNYILHQKEELNINIDYDNWLNIRLSILVCF